MLKEFKKNIRTNKDNCLIRVDKKQEQKNYSRVSLDRDKGERQK